VRIQPRGQRKRQGEGKPDTDSHHGHRLGPLAIAGMVGNQGRDRRRNRSASLQNPSGDQAGQIGGKSAHEGTREHAAQTKCDHAPAPEAVRCPSQGNLQEGLRQTGSSHGQTHQQAALATWQQPGVLCQHRKDDEKAQHAQPEHMGQREADPTLEPCHRLLEVIHGS